MKRRAILSVYDKAGLVKFGAGLSELGFELIASGGTARTLAAAGLPVTHVEQCTGYPEILGGRVKTLHPAVLGGILARRTPEHLAELAGHDIRPVDLVVCNLYPFAATVARPNVTEREVIEEIDIGGVTLLRAAAKNFESVAVLCDPADYESVLAALRDDAVAPDMRRRLALKAFRHTAAYDAAIATWLGGCVSESVGAALETGKHPERSRGRAPDGVEGCGLAERPLRPFDSAPLRSGCSATSSPEGAVAPRAAWASALAQEDAQVPLLPDIIILAAERVQALRYGENPHQQAALYRWVGAPPAFTQLQGKELSYNNIVDLDAAWAMPQEFAEPAVAIIKHTNPSGLATAGSLQEAYRLALACDPVSAFGSIIAVNRQVDLPFVQAIGSLFVEVLTAPAYTPDALAWLAEHKRSCRVMVARGGEGGGSGPRVALRSVQGGLLAQTSDERGVEEGDWQVVTRRPPTDVERGSLAFAWLAVKHVKSNAIVFAQGSATVGVGAGQMNRVDAVYLAARRAGARARGAVMGSDAFIPFPDSIEAAAAAGVSACIQPGGSLRDADAIAAADQAGMAMVFTGERHFRH